MNKKLIALLVSIAICATILVVALKTFKRDFATLSGLKLEQHVMEKLSIEKISANYTPVLLYRLMADNTTQIVASGTYFIGAGEGPQLLTAEHLFSKDIEQIESPIVLRILRPLDQPLGLAISGVLHKGSEINGWDVCICSLSNKIHPIMENYASVKGASQEFLAYDTNVTLSSGKRLARVRSLVSGQWYDLIGGSRDAPNGKIMGVCVNGKFYHGESGSGFIDEEGSIYVLVTVQNETLPTWPEIKASALAVYKGKLEGVATLAGPLAIRAK